MPFASRLGGKVITIIPAPADMKDICGMCGIIIHVNMK